MSGLTTDIPFIASLWIRSGYLPYINICWLRPKISRSTHCSRLGHNTWKVCLLMGQNVHLVLFRSIHSITRTMPNYDWYFGAGILFHRNLFISTCFLCQIASINKKSLERKRLSSFPSLSFQIKTFCLTKRHLATWQSYLWFDWSLVWTGVNRPSNSCTSQKNRQEIHILCSIYLRSQWPEKSQVHQHHSQAKAHPLTVWHVACLIGFEHQESRPPLSHLLSAYIYRNIYLCFLPLGR